MNQEFTLFVKAGVHSEDTTQEWRGHSDVSEAGSGTAARTFPLVVVVIK